MSHWFLIHTKVQQEQLALEHLKRHGFECFLPLLWVEKQIRGTVQRVQEALFPRYLFIRPSSGMELARWATMGSVTGVKGLVSQGPMPALVQDALVAKLRRLTASADNPSGHSSEPGGPNVATDETLIEVEAAYRMADAEGRVMLLLDILSQQAKPAVLPADMRKVS